jgi:hypothetical protein
MVQQGELRVHDIGDRQLGESGTVRLSSCGIDRGGAGGSVTSADIIHTDNEELIGIEGFSGPDKVVPPTDVTVLCPNVTYGINPGV